MVDGIENKIDPGNPLDLNLFEAKEEILKTLDKLPKSLDEAKMISKESDFIKKYVNERILESYIK
jgi:glutamine synthetase